MRTAAREGCGEGREWARSGGWPGFIGDTAFHTTFSSPEAQRAMVAGTALGRAGSPADVAAVVAFLASPDSGYLTGTVSDINGGSYFT